MPSPPATIAEVISRMEAILDPLTNSDGVACFTKLYLGVTEGVQARLHTLSFAIPYSWRTSTFDSPTSTSLRSTRRPGLTPARCRAPGHR
jgi:Family of unknown function (DUF5995)